MEVFWGMESPPLLEDDGYDDDGDDDDHDGPLIEVFWGMEAPPLLEGPPLLFSHHQSDVIIRHTAKPIMEWWEASVEISGLTLSLMIMLIGRVSMSLVWDYSNIGFVVITVEESEDMEVCRPFLPSAWPRMSACNSQGHL